MWWKIHLENIKQVFKGELWTQYHNEQAKKFADDNGIKCVPGKGGQGLGDEFVYHGSNSGHQALNLAYVLSMKEGYIPRLFMLGYDMGATGQTHWFGKHPDKLCNGNHRNFVNQFNGIAERFKQLGIECVNLTRQTNLTQFKRSTIDDWDFHSLQH